MKSLAPITGIFASALLLFTCTPDLSNPDPQPGEANFSKVIAVGGNFMAGYQDGALYPDGQNKSLPALLCRQFELTGGGVFTQHTITSGLGWNSKPWESWYIGASHLGWRTDCEGTVSLGPLKDSVSTGAATSLYANSFLSTNGNFAVPFATTAELLSPALGNSPAGNTNPFYHRFASAPGISTPVSDAVNANATFFTAWLGMEDIFEYARRGGEGTTIASSAQFSVYLDSILGALTANGAKGVIANIPDFREFPYYTLVPWNGADLTQNKADSLNDIYDVSGLTHIRFHEGSNAFVINDPDAPSGVRQIRRNEYITLGIPLDSMKCNFMGILFSTLPDRYVLDSAEVAFIDQSIAAYNAVIEQKAAQYGLALVDMRGFFRSMNAGIVWDGVEFNDTFVSGGFYSLDGYHPNQKGYALIANEFIYAINAKYGATVPTLNCEDCNGVLFP
ncbi:MAG TPA: SGNH/GDSL hydrolase family protein [Bacteroidia bacterium]|nr:SGNH/GDSL hydrolase family protein [Bacteroidia bacterium]